MSARLGAGLRAVLLVAAALVVALPLLIMLSTALKSTGELSAFPPTWLPVHWTWGNLSTALTSNGFPRQLLSSLIYAGGSMVANVVLCSLAGFAFARMRFAGRSVLFGLVLAVLMVPAQSQIVPVFVVLQHIPFAGGNAWNGTGGTGLLDSYAGLILPMAATPLGIFLMRQFFSTVPPEYDEAARIDGANWFTVYWRIVLPLARPALATLAVLSFQNAWNDFVWPLIVTSDPSKATLQLGLQLYASGPDTQTNLLLAATFLSVLPMLVLFLFAQRFFVGGLAGAGVKG